MKKETFTISPAAHRKVKEYCTKKNIKLGEFIESAIILGIEKELINLNKINVSMIQDAIDSIDIINDLHEELHKALNK